MASRWFDGAAVTYELDKLLATKMRARCQRRKGRDLFDLAVGLDGMTANRVESWRHSPCAWSERVVVRPVLCLNETCWASCAIRSSAPILDPLLAHGYRRDTEKAAQEVSGRLLLSGAPWKGMD